METPPVSIAETIVHGVAFDPKNSQQVKGMDLNKLFASVGRLFDLLEEREVDYLLVGGVAMLAYVEGRNTQDIDLVLSTADLAKLPELLVEDQNPEFARATFGDLQVDLLLTDNKLFRQVLKDCSAPKQFAERSVLCATQVGLITLKLFALPSLYRQGQFDKVEIYQGDIAALLRTQSVDLEQVQAMLLPVLSESDYQEVGKIAEEIRERVAKSQDRFQSE